MKYYFSDEDIIRIKEDADFIDIFQHLGITYDKPKGRNISYLCPFHNDTRFGSAKYNMEKNTCRCYVCNQKYSPLDLIMGVEGLTVYEAVCRLADIEGVLDNYIVSTESAEPTIRPQKNQLKKLTTEQKKLLGFDVDTIDKGCMIGISFEKVFSREEISDYIPEIGGFKVGKKGVLNWNYLFKNYPLEYRTLVIGRVMEKKEQFEKEISNLETFLKSYKDGYRWFYEEIISMKKKELAEILNIGKTYGLSN